MTNPNQDPNQGRPAETPEMRDEALAMKRNIDVQKLVDGGTAEPVAEQLVDMKEQIATSNENNNELRKRVGSLTGEVAQLESESTHLKDKLRRSRRLNKVLGGVAVALSAVAVWSPFGDRTVERVGTPANSAQTNNDNSKSNQSTVQQSQFGAQTSLGAVPSPTTKSKENDPSASTTQKQKITIGNSSNVASAVKSLNIDSSDRRAEVLKHYANGNINLELNNIHNKMNAMSAEGTGINKKLTAVGLAMFSDTTEGNQYGKASINFNTKNNRSINAETGMSAKEQEAFNAKFMTADNAKNYEKSYTGYVYNGYMEDGGEINEQLEYFDGETVLVREVKGMGTLMWKVTKDSDGKICLNLIRKAPTPKVSQPGGGERVTPPTTTTTETPTPGKNKIENPAPEKPVQPTQPKPGENETERPAPEKPPVKPPKTSDGKIPGPNKAPSAGGTGDAVRPQAGSSPIEVPKQGQTPKPALVTADPHTPETQGPADSNPVPVLPEPAINADPETINKPATTLPAKP